MGRGVTVNASVKQVVNLVPGLSPIDLAARALPVLGWDGFSLVEARAWSTRRLIAPGQAAGFDRVPARHHQATAVTIGQRDRHLKVTGFGLDQQAIGQVDSHEPAPVPARFEGRHRRRRISITAVRGRRTTPHHAHWP